MKKLLALYLLMTACGQTDLAVLEGTGTTVKSYIIGGTPAGTIPEHDAVVGLHGLTKRYGGAVYVYPFCSGTLIAPDIVLTAAHCLDEAEDYAPTDPIEPNELAIYVGNAPGSLDANGNYDVLNGLYYVSEVQIHSGYNKFTISNDIGLVRLKQNVTSVTPVSNLPAANGFVQADEGTLTMDLVGFGEDENGDYGVKLHANVTLNSILNDTQIEHVYNPEGICFGDSGGPALVSRDGAYMVGGVASYVTYPYCANTGAHTRVDSFEAFIDSFSGGNTEPPTNTCTDLLPLGAACSSNSECCSNKCRGGRYSDRTCR